MVSCVCARVSGRLETLGVQISKKVQVFCSKLKRLLIKEQNIGCATAHPAHQLPLTLCEISKGKSLFMIKAKYKTYFFTSLVFEV